MADDYICDDRGVWEFAQKIRAMTDAEKKEYMKELQKKQNELNSISNKPSE